MFDGYDAAVMGFIAPALIEDWGISRAEMGPILGAAMFGVALGALLASTLAQALAGAKLVFSAATAASNSAWRLAARWFSARR